MNGPRELALYDARFAEVLTGIESESSRATVEIVERWWPNRFEKWVKQNGEMLLLESYEGPRPFLSIALTAQASGDSASTVKE